MKDLNYYMDLDYTLKVIPDTDYDGTKYFIARYEELGGLIGTGESMKEAIEDLLDVKESWFELNLELGRVIPIPITESEDTAPVKMTLRLPKTLDKDVITYAENEGISKNSAITYLVQKGLYEDKVSSYENQTSELLTNVLGLFGLNFTRDSKTVIDVQQFLSPIKKVEEADKHYKSPRKNSLKFI